MDMTRRSRYYDYNSVTKPDGRFPYDQLNLKEMLLSDNEHDLGHVIKVRIGSGINRTTHRIWGYPMLVLGHPRYYTYKPEPKPLVFSKFLSNEGYKALIQKYFSTTSLSPIPDQFNHRNFGQPILGINHSTIVSELRNIIHFTGKSYFQTSEQEKEEYAVLSTLMDLQIHIRQPGKSIYSIRDNKDFSTPEGRYEQYAKNILGLDLLPEIAFTELAQDLAYLETLPSQMRVDPFNPNNIVIHQSSQSLGFVDVGQEDCVLMGFDGEEPLFGKDRFEPNCASFLPRMLLQVFHLHGERDSLGATRGYDIRGLVMDDFKLRRAANSVYSKIQDALASAQPPVRNKSGMERVGALMKEFLPESSLSL